MLHYSDLKGVIFDVDDTLLDNFSRFPEKRLHERARLAAIREVGKRYDVAVLMAVTPEQNVDCFLTAPQHTMDSAVWNLMYKLGLVKSQDIDHSNQYFKEIVARKDDMYEALLREEGEPIPGAPDFVRTLAAHGLDGRLSIASTAIRRDIDIFLEKVGLTTYFPEWRIISKDRVTNPKPHPEAYELAFQTLGLTDKAGVAVFEDDPRGIAAAKAAGLRVFAITSAFDREVLAALDVAPDIIADSYAEFTELLGLPQLDLESLEPAAT